MKDGESGGVSRGIDRLLNVHFGMLRTEQGRWKMGLAKTDSFATNPPPLAFFTSRSAITANGFARKLATASCPIH